jgi:putative transposase
LPFRLSTKGFWTGFFSSPKTERTARRTYRICDAARSDVFDYIERFGNVKRWHSTMGYLSPRRVR